MKKQESIDRLNAVKQALINSSDLQIPNGGIYMPYNHSEETEHLIYCSLETGKRVYIPTQLKEVFEEINHIIDYDSFSKKNKTFTR